MRKGTNLFYGRLLRGKRFLASRSNRCLHSRWHLLDRPQPNFFADLLGLRPNKSTPCRRGRRKWLGLPHARTAVAATHQLTVLPSSVASVGRSQWSVAATAGRLPKPGSSISTSLTGAGGGWGRIGLRTTSLHWMMRSSGCIACCTHYLAPSQRWLCLPDLGLRLRQPSLYGSQVFAELLAMLLWAPTSDRPSITTDITHPPAMTRCLLDDLTDTNSVGE